MAWKTFQEGISDLTNQQMESNSRDREMQGKRWGEGLFWLGLFGGREREKIKGKVMLHLYYVLASWRIRWHIAIVSFHIVLANLWVLGA